MGDWDLYPPGAGLKITGAGAGAVFSGSVNTKGAGYVIESRNLGLAGKRRLILVVSGITEADRFDHGKLLKLELDGQIAAVMNGPMNRNDNGFINAANGEYVFDLSTARNIRKVNIVFFNCELTGLKLEMFTE